MLRVLVNNQPEVLMRITGLLRRRGFNIKSISMVETSDPSLAHVTIRTDEDNKCVKQAIHQMEKCVDVHEITQIDHMMGFERQWDLMKIKAKEMNLEELLYVMDKLDVNYLSQLPLKETGVCSAI